MSIETVAIQAQNAIANQAQHAASTQAHRLGGVLNSGVVTDSEAEQAVSQFSSLLINMMIDSMRKTIAHEDSAATDGLRNEFFTDLLFQQYSELLADTDALGLNSLISESLSR